MGISWWVYNRWCHAYIVVPDLFLNQMESSAPKLGPNPGFSHVFTPTRWRFCTEKRCESRLISPGRMQHPLEIVRRVHPNGTTWLPRTGTPEHPGISSLLSASGFSSPKRSLDSFTSISGGFYPRATNNARIPKDLQVNHIESTKVCSGYVRKIHSF